MNVLKSEGIGDTATTWMNQRMQKRSNNGASSDGNRQKVNQRISKKQIASERASDTDEVRKLITRPSVSTPEIDSVEKDYDDVLEIKPEESFHESEVEVVCVTEKTVFNNNNKMASGAGTSGGGGNVGG